MKSQAPSARKRAELIMKVRCGLMSATQAAAELGVSRKTYYKWERKGLAGMLASVGDRSAGRHRQGPEPWESVLERQLAAAYRQGRVAVESARPEKDHAV